VHGAIFEAVHGTAPDIAGKGIAQPRAVVLAACMLLEHLGDAERAGRIRDAFESTIARGRTLPDARLAARPHRRVHRRVIAKLG
jgi:isocitrate dehydrogenase (NAD+)